MRCIGEKRDRGEAGRKEKRKIQEGQKEKREIKKEDGNTQGGERAC